MSEGKWRTSTLSGLPVFVPDPQLPKFNGPVSKITETPKTLLEEALEQVEGYTRRIVALETRIDALEAALDKLTGEK